MLSMRAVAVFGAMALAAPAFAGFDELITFEEVPLGTNADGLMIGNSTFSFEVMGRGAPAAVGVGPGVTPYTTDPGIEGPTFGVLGVRFAQPVSRFSFGFALTAFGLVEDAVCVDVFDPQGSYLTTLKADADSLLPRGDGAPVVFSAGILFGEGQGCIGALEIRFSQFQELPGKQGGVGIERFLFDNLGYDFCELSVVPLPTPAFLGGVGLLTLSAVRRRRDR